MLATRRPEYRVWSGIKTRCTNSKDKFFHCYGGRGIKVCDRWLNSFENFLADMGERPFRWSQLDRINCDGHYEPGNCRWTTPKENARNRSTSHILTVNGQSKTLAEWEEITGINYQVLWTRLTKLGWTPEETINTPARKCKPRQKTTVTMEPCYVI